MAERALGCGELEGVGDLIGEIVGVEVVSRWRILVLVHGFWAMGWIVGFLQTRVAD